MRSDGLPADPGRIALVAAVARNGVIGDRGTIPWRLSSDMRRFKALTTGHTLIMGRRTYQSIGKPLPGRRTIVVTSGEVGGVDTATSLADALASAGRPAFLVGGSAIYAEGMAHADTIHLTHVDAEPPGDAFFPAIDPAVFALVESCPQTASERDAHDFVYATYRRRTAAGAL